MKIVIIDKKLSRNEVEDIIELASDNSDLLMNNYPNILTVSEFYHEQNSLVKYNNTLFKVFVVIYSESFDRIGRVLISIENNFDVLRLRSNLDCYCCKKCGMTDIHRECSAEMTRKQQAKIVDIKNVRFCADCHRYWEIFEGGIEKNIGNSSIKKLKI